MAAPYYQIAPVQYVLCQNEIRMHLYLHQVVSGPNPVNQQLMVPSPHPFGFGSIAVNDWTVLDAPNPKANIIARAKGIHVQTDITQAPAGWSTSFNMVFQDERFKGSSLQVMGVLQATDEVAIVGGTGEFSMARGTIKYKIIQNTPNVESMRELDIRAFYTPKTPTVQGTVAIANATGDQSK